jgi:hypothetical protein
VVLQDRYVLTLDQAAIVSRSGAYASVVKKSLNLADCPPGAATCGPEE